uniref:tRNA methyltransferase 10 homolog C-like n=1 Tax=Styela clava TaxID=7725 RepID=UPI00193AA66B|nr:tRNA methyltransferase 10 homolog C-like [Styela clava]
MHKSAMRSNGKRQKAKNTVVEENYGSVLFRRNMVPYHHVEKETRVFCNWHLLSGAPLDNPIIFDMGFEDLMKRKSLVDLCAQLTTTLNYNTTVHYPVPLLFANLDQDSFFYRRMKQFNVHSFPDGCMSVTEKGLTDLDNIPIESLIYLSPDATETINEYQEDKVYVIGGLVDLGAVQAQKTTLTIANELGIKRQKLPLSKYLLWGNRSGRRTLSLDIIFKVLLELRSTGNWAKAFQHIPVRCHRGLTECGIEEAEKTKDINLMRHYADIFQHKERVSKPRNNKDSYQFLAWDSKA